MGFCDEFSRKILIVLNSVVILAGIACIVGGAIVKTNLEDYVQYVQIDELRTASRFLAATPWIFIGFGSAVVFIGFCGCCGACGEKVWMLKMYITCLVVILASVVAVSAFIFIQENAVRVGLQLAFYNLMVTYNQTSDVLDVIQTNIKCCGVESYIDWEQSDAWLATAHQIAQESDQVAGSHPVPDSCCIVPEEGCGIQHDSGELDIYTEGCAPIVWRILRSNVKVVTYIGLILAATITTCIVFACCVIKTANNDYMRY